MKYCPKCGAKINENQKFCSECAAPLKALDDKTVGIFENEDVQSADTTVSIFNEKKETNAGSLKKKSTKSKIKNSSGKKVKYGIIIAVAILVVGILGYFSFKSGGLLSDVTDAVVYDENDTSANISLEKEMPNPASLSYYDFMTSNCPQEHSSVWETVESVQGYKSKYQVNEADVDSPYIVFEVDLKGSITKDDFNNTVRILKDRLDILEMPYAIKYEKGFNDSYVVWVKTETSRMGSPVFLMLAHRKGGLHNSKQTISSQDGSYKAFDIEDFYFKKRLSGEYDMFITIKGTPLDSELYKDYEKPYNELLEFMKSHIGENMYWVYGGNAFANLPIDKKMISDFEKNGEFRFSELSFLNNRKPKKEESFLLKLLYVSLKGEQYPCDIKINNNNSIEFSEGANETNLGYHINTSVDESLRNTVASLHANSLCYRPAMSSAVGSVMRIDIIYDEAEYNDVEFAKLVKKIYESDTAISGAGYQDVYITAKSPSINAAYMQEEQIMHFCKEPTGEISASLVFDHKASDELKDYIKNDDLFVKLQNKR